MRCSSLCSPKMTEVVTHGWRRGVGGTESSSLVNADTHALRCMYAREHRQETHAHTCPRGWKPTQDGTQSSRGACLNSSLPLCAPFPISHLLTLVSLFSNADCLARRSQKGIPTPPLISPGGLGGSFFERPSANPGDGLRWTCWVPLRPCQGDKELFCVGLGHVTRPPPGEKGAEHQD